DVLPGGRDDKGPDPVESRGVLHAFAGGLHVFEVPALADAAESRFVVGRVDQAGLGGRICVAWAQAAVGGVTPGPPHSGCIAVSRLRLRAHSLAISSSRVVSSLHGKPSWHRLARISRGRSSSAR